MKIILYNDEYRSDLELLLKSISEYLYDGKYDVDLFVSSHWAIYLSLNSDGIVTGFSSFNIIDYYGFRESILSNTFIYVLPEYRNSKAMYLFSLQAGKIAIEHNMKLEHYYASLDSKKLSRKLKGEKIYETWLYDIDEIKREYDRLSKFIKIKE